MQRYVMEEKVPRKYIGSSQCRSAGKDLESQWQLRDMSKSEEYEEEDNNDNDTGSSEGEYLARDEGILMLIGRFARLNLEGPLDSSKKETG